MPDYNKGDFTQQGIDGFVEGGLHLNEKRCLTARISTDEETSGIDSIEINIHDHLNDLDYAITGENLGVGGNIIGGLTSATFTENGTFEASDLEVVGWDEVTVNVPLPSGNIAITENTPEGEPLDISQYATATVNVPVPVPEKHYVIPNGTYTSMVLGDVSGIYLPSTYFFAPEIVFNIDGVEHILNGMAAYSSDRDVHVVYREEDDAETVLMLVIPSFMSMSGTFIPTTDTEPTAHTISAYYVGEKKYWQVLSVKNSSAQFAQYETYLYGDHLVSNVLNLDNGDYSAPILVYPYTTTIYLCFTYGTATSIVCSTSNFPSSGYYNTPSDENNLAFITWADNVS